nr:unnamed protein product [Callosobruchus chinensis]
MNCDNDKSILLHEFLNFNNLAQYNVVKNFMDRCLDLIMSNYEILNVRKADATLVAEDQFHPAIEFDIILKEAEATVAKEIIKKQYSYDYRKGNFMLLYQLMKFHSWSDLYNCEKVDDCLDLFYDKMYSILDLAIPKYTVNKNPQKPKYPRWYSLDLVRKMRYKNYLHKLIVKIKANPLQKNLYKELRKEIKLQIKNEHKLYKLNIEANINHDPNSFWHFIRSKSRSRGLPQEMKLDGSVYSTSTDIADAFAQFFHSVFQASENPSSYRPSASTPCIDLPLVSEHDVLNAIKKLKSKKSTGIDNIPAYIYKGLAEYLAKPLMHLFNLSISSRQFPNRLKTALVTPIHKNGNINEIKNYRPITLINTIAKIFESVLSAYLTKLLQPQISKFQHGFVAERTTVSNLCVLSEHAAEAILNKKQLDVIFTDCEKAFDKVDHGLLLDRMVSMGVTYPTFAFLKSYLLDWSLMVKIGNVTSNKYVATSGVPQGSILGPLLFTLFINPLPDCISNSIGLLFADDFKLFKTITSPQDCLLLQRDINAVICWLKDNKMSVNIKKCCVMTFTRKTNAIEYNYNINKVVLERKTEIKDLGVIFQSDMRFNAQYIQIVNIAYKYLGFVIRNSNSFELNTVIKLYHTLVRPHLEYAMQIWMPTADTHIDHIEKVQKRFLRYLYVRKNNTYPYLISYKSQLHNFGFKSLLERRNKQAVIFIYHVINCTKYKDCDLVKYININVPKIILRNRNFEIFSADKSSTSPINKMLQICNQYTRSTCLDIFNTTLSEVKTVLS